MKKPNQVSLFDVMSEQEDPMRIRELEEKIAALEFKLDESERSNKSLAEDLEATQEAKNALAYELEEAKGEIGNLKEDIDAAKHEAEIAKDYDPYPIAEAVHNFLRDQKVITDPGRDVPLKVASFPWCTDLVSAVSEGMPS